MVVPLSNTALTTPLVSNATPVRKLKARPFWFRNETEKVDEYWVKPLGVPEVPRLSVNPVPPKAAAPSFRTRPVALAKLVGDVATVPLVLNVTSAPDWVTAVAAAAVPRSAVPLSRIGNVVLVAEAPVATTVMLLILATQVFVLATVV